MRDLRYEEWFFFSNRRRHTRLVSDWSSDVCSSDLTSAAKGPDTRSPPLTTVSTPASSTSTSTASRAGRLPWTSYNAATRTAWNLPGERQARPCADEVEGRTVGACELAGGRAKVSNTNARDRCGELDLESGNVVSCERGRDDDVGPLEELVRD